MSKTVRRGKVIDKGEILPEELTLEITYETDERAGEIIDWAFANPIPFDTVKANFEKAQLMGVPYIPPFEAQLRVEHGFEVAYWHELTSQGAPIRRIYVSCPSKVPPPPAVSILMRVFGFINPMVTCKVWLSQIDRRHYAVNVLEPVNGDWESLKGPIH